ncbi:uncharacterized protein LOC127878691 [Dreissena polymorpha]|nr:uncharacterized protein LOC127878691 [Dreissena polymorpha]
MVISWLSSEVKTLEHLKNSSACLLKCTIQFWEGSSSPREATHSVQGALGSRAKVSCHTTSTGFWYSDIQYSLQVAENTLSVVVRDVCHAICEGYVDEVMTAPSTPEEWRQLADGFLKNWNFPNWDAAIDGTHIAIRKYVSSGSLYYNYKGFVSIILLAIVASDYKFVWFDRGDPQPFPNDTVDMPYFLVGDDAFSLSDNIKKPYGHRVLTRDVSILNYLLPRARRISENAFGILANRFQILLTKTNHNPSTVRLTVKTCCILHNLMRIVYSAMQNALVDHDDRRDDLVPGEWRRGRNLEDTRNVNTRDHNTAIKKARL